MRRCGWRDTVATRFLRQDSRQHGLRALLAATQPRQRRLAIQRLPIASAMQSALVSSRRSRVLVYHHQVLANRNEPRMVFTRAMRTTMRVESMRRRG